MPTRCVSVSCRAEDHRVPCIGEYVRQLLQHSRRKRREIVRMRAVFVSAETPPASHLRLPPSRLPLATPLAILTTSRSVAASTHSKAIASMFWPVVDARATARTLKSACSTHTPGRVPLELW